VLRVEASDLPKAAVLYDPNICDLEDDGTGEAYNVLQTLSGWGYHYNTIETNVLSDWHDALADAQVLVFPEPGEAGRAHSSDPLAYLGLGIINQVRMFVAVGGLFVQMGDNLTMVPHIFNTNWPLGGSSSDPSVPTAARSGSVFSNCTYSLAGLDLVYHYNSSLVNQTECLQYKANTNNGCTLLRVGYGQGVVIWIGYDWYQARPVGTQDGGWLAVLRNALREAPTPPPSPSASPTGSPSPSQSASPSTTPTPSLTPSITPSVTPSAPPSTSPTSSPSPSPSSSLSPTPSVTSSPSNSPSISPSHSASSSGTPTVSPTRTPSRTPSKSATPSISPAPATAGFAESDTSLHFYSQGPNVLILAGASLPHLPSPFQSSSLTYTLHAEATNRSAVLKFNKIALLDSNGDHFSTLTLPNCN
jgi:hypothetical protein